MGHNQEAEQHRESRTFIGLSVIEIADTGRSPPERVRGGYSRVKC